MRLCTDGTHALCGIAVMRGVAAEAVERVSGHSIGDAAGAVWNGVVNVGDRADVKVWTLGMVIR